MKFDIGKEKFEVLKEEVTKIQVFCDDVLCNLVLYCIVVGSRRLMPPDALQPKAYCTNPGL